MVSNPTIVFGLLVVNVDKIDLLDNQDVLLDMQERKINTNNLSEIMEFVTAWFCEPFQQNATIDIVGNAILIANKEAKGELFEDKLVSFVEAFSPMIDSLECNYTDAQGVMKSYKYDHDEGHLIIRYS